MSKGAIAELRRFMRRMPALYPVEGANAIQRRGMAMLWGDSIVSSLSGAFYGDFVVIYLLALGANTSVFGLRASINSAAALAAPLLGAWLVERSSRRKLWVLLWPGGASRIALLLMALIPFVFEGSAAVIAFVVLVAIQSFSDSLGGPAGNSLLGDILPVAIRGRYLGARMTFSSAIRAGTVTLAGWLIKQIGGMVGLQAAWVLAALFGFWATSYYARIPEPESAEGKGRQNEGLRGLAEDLRLFIRDRRFVTFCAISFIWNFGVSIAGPFFQVHMVRDLGFAVDTVAVLATVTTVVSVIAYRLAGELVDRVGAARITSVSMLLVPLMPLFWVFAQVPWHVALVQSYGNLAWSGFHVASTPLLLLLTPPEHRSRYVAIFNTVNGLASVIAPLPAGWVFTHWGFTANGLLSAAGRGLGGLLFFLFLRRGGFKGIEDSKAAQSSQ